MAELEAPSALDALELAKGVLPMPRLFQQYGMGEFTEKESAKRKECPWCSRVGKLQPKRIDNKYWVFKCWGPGCPANDRTQGKDEVGFVAIKEGLDRKGAFHRYLEMAGVKIVTPPEKRTKRRKAAAKAAQDAPDEQAQHPALDAPTKPTEPPEEPSREEPPDLSALFAGGGQQPPPPPASSSSATAKPERRSVWEAFFAKLHLTDADRTRLRLDRGFSDDTIDRLGFRSNNRRNEVALNSLTDEFTMRELLRSGLFKRGRGGAPVIESQFTGWGLESKKKTDKGQDEDKWGQMERPLIPYLDDSGGVWFMRPHKGNIAKEDKDDDEVCGGHVYCPYLLASRVEDNSGLCVLTESEFKAAALWQCGIPAIGIPGTAFVRNHFFRTELVRLLEHFHVTDLVIAFDNEVKDIPGLPGYKADPRQRYQTVVWARYIAWDLMKKTPRPPMLETVRIAQLPDAWRLDENGRETGKIDWDTALARFVRKEGGDARRGTNVARAEFEKVVDNSQSPNEFLDLWPNEAQRVITVQLNHLFREPLLKSGGKREESLARRFDRIQPSKDHDEIENAGMLVGIARDMSKALRSVSGTYYERKRPSEKRAARLYHLLDDVREAIDKANAANDPTNDDHLARLKLQKRLIEEAIEGLYEPISNFILRCEYCLHTTEGKTERLMRFVNNQTERTKLIRVPGAAFSRLADWRTFCNERTQGVAVWRGAEKALQALVEDMKNYSAFSDIYEIPHYGLHRESGIWFFGDCAYSPDGQTLLADENNVFWWNGIGYQVDASKEERGQHFDQGAPLLLSDSYPRVKEDTELAALFAEWINQMFVTIGDYDALLGIGVVLGYAAAPEVYRDKGAHPGLWLYGKRASGKTTIARWLMRIWGFRELPGVRIDRGTTHVGMQRDLNQYAFLPFWFDEYRRDVDDQKESVLRGAFDRSSTSKGQVDGGTTNRTRQAKTLTTPIITGESSSNDGATRSRYAHILVAANRRLRDGEKERFDKLQGMSRELHRIGRFLMENRAVFVAATLKRLDEWLSHPDVRRDIPDERTRVVHGYGFAAILAFMDLISPDVDIIDDIAFRLFLITHSAQALHDVQEETMINKFWTALISGIQREAVSPKFFRITDAQLAEDGSLIAEKSKFELNGRPTIKVLYIAAQPAFDEYAQDIRRQGLDAPLSKSDIQREISKESYFIPTPHNSVRSHRATLGDFRGACWVLRLAAFPYGEEVEDALSKHEPA